ncbi:MAG: helix-turn-helix transcriptional regulator [Saprospiraceae bacterium]
MSPPPNYLRAHRKRSSLTQADIAFLMKLPDYSNISRYEKGQREPSVEFLLVYHLLFNTTVESFFETQSGIILPGLVEQVQQLIDNLKKEKPHDPRIKFLKGALIRINQTNHL